MSNLIPIALPRPDEWHGDGRCIVITYDDIADYEAAVAAMSTCADDNEPMVGWHQHGGGL